MRSKDIPGRWIIEVEYVRERPELYTFAGTQTEAAAQMNELSLRRRDLEGVISVGLYELDEWFDVNDIRHELD